MAWVQPKDNSHGPVGFVPVFLGGLDTSLLYQMVDGRILQEVLRWLLCEFIKEA